METATDAPSSSTAAFMAPVPVLAARITARMRNLTRPKFWYMAVAEAVKNAMDSIEDSPKSGRIEVTLVRGSELLSEDGRPPPVREVSIRDNGAGFHGSNFKSFCTPDSSHKLLRGGKGLGRLVCLQAFERIEGSSTFEENGERMHREFVLQPGEPEISQHMKAAEAEESGTEVRLMGLREEYHDTASVDFEKLVNWLAEHFLPALVERPPLLEEIKISDGTRSVDLMAKLSAGAVWSESFHVNAYPFTASCYRFNHGNDGDQVRLVAGGRVVDANTRGVDHYISHLQSVAEGSGHVVLVRSPFFDEHVNDARNGISFAEDTEDLTLLGVTSTQFRSGVISILSKQVSSHLEKSRAKFRKRIEEVVRKEAPYYRHLLDGYFEAKEFTELSTRCRDDDILTSLDSHKRRIASGLKKESRRLARLQAEGADFAGAAKKLAEQIEAQKKVALAEYVSLRKIVLDRLSQLLDLRDTGKAHREDAIHDLVFPRRTDSQKNPDFAHQLWIVDERLESNRYLASDQPLQVKSGDRPDILALDLPSVFAGDPGAKSKGYDRFSIVEFKRALLDVSKISTDDLPHRQMMRYAQQIQNGKSLHCGSGRPIKATVDARYYMYAICEFPAELRARLVRDEGFTPSPTNEGAFCVKNDGRYYLEYISLEKLLDDARMRNASFFSRLDLE